MDAIDYIITEKLDGISALLVVNGTKSYLYLRGDGVKGVDVSFMIGYLKLGAASTRGQYMVRGELVLPLASTPAGSIGRSLINGWLHRGSSAANASNAAAYLSSVHFLAYEVMEPVLSRKDQFTWLMSNKFRTPWVHGIRSDDLNEETAKEMLVNRRRDSEYPLDGIVIGVEAIPAPIGGGEAKNPSDCIAFKAPLDEQRSSTTVVQVEWNASRQGMLIPRIEIEPVIIGGARIQWLSGHNASLIHKNGIGPGARIVVRRSGDVIPTLDSVLEKVDASMPAVSWKWDSSQTHAINSEESVEKDSVLHALQTLGVENIGPGLVDKLLAAGFTSMKKLWGASSAKLAEIIGAGRGPTLYQNLRTCVAKASQMQMLIASNRLPRSVGEKKLRLLYAKEADANKWTSEGLPGLSGWSKETLEELLAIIPEALEWSKCFGTAASASASYSSLPSSSPPLHSVNAQPTKFVVFTGCRDKALEQRILTLGWEIQDTVNKKTTVLVTDTLDSQTSKIKKARDLGIRIMLLPEFSSWV
jgi:DNA ligase (NAD+)